MKNNEMLNDPEFAEIIEIEAERVKKETEFKKQYHSGLKITISNKCNNGKIFYEIEGVEKLRQKYNKLVDILNEKGVING